MAEETGDFWQSHSTRFLEMAFRMDRNEALTHPDGFGQKLGDCGDQVSFFLTVKNDRLERVSFTINGCLNTQASANTVAELTEGKTIAEAWEITPDTVAEYLQSLPIDHYHCAELAVGAFYLALTNYEQLKREPWKKVYR